MVPERLLAQLGAIEDHRFGLIVAPPGAGKSTLLAAFAAEQVGPVAWYVADRWDGLEERLVARLRVAFGGLLGDEAGPWSGIDDVISWLAAIDGPYPLLVIDDLHMLEGTAAEAAIERLVEHGPVRLRTLAASRGQPHMNLSRLRLSGDLLEVSADDLRLRTWEVEQLFRDHYREPMRPEDLARLARWTEGWAAGLQLFHLATRGRPSDERRRILGSLGPGSRLAREYLAQNVLARVPDEIRRFLVQTSVLGRLNGPLCDRLLGRSGSADLLEELEQRCLFTTRAGLEGSYRYHEVFRAYLQGVLVSEEGEARARARFVAAAELLLAEGSPAEALEAYVRAEAWDAVERILAAEGHEIAREPLRWLSLEAERSVREDAWLALAGARRLRAEGRFAAAVGAYAFVDTVVRPEAAASAAYRERAALLAWLDPDAIRAPQPGHAWWAVLRTGLRHGPRGAAAQHGAHADHDPDAGARIVGCLLLLAAGEIRLARDALDEVAERPDAEGLIACIAQMGRGAAGLLAGDDNGIVDLNGAIGAAEGLGWEWLARVGRALLALSGRPDHLRESARLERSAIAADDSWGLALGRLARAWGMLVASARGPGPLDEASDAASVASAVAQDLLALGAPVLQLWATAIGAMASALAGDAGAVAREVSRVGALVRTTAIEAPHLLGRLAEALRDGDEAAAMAVRDELADRFGLSLPPTPLGRAEAIDPIRPAAAGTMRSASSAVITADGVPAPPAVLHLLGQFRLELGGAEVDLAAIRPRVRSLLRLLASHVGQAVHREVIVEALWPDADADAAPRNLHVAVASLRRVLEPQASRGGFRLLRREGEAYRLVLPPGSQVDLLGFEGAIDAAHRAATADDVAGVEHWTRVALGRYAGDLLPEEGPAEWVVGRRELLRAQATNAATRLARILIDRGEGEAAAAVCGDALRRERYHDPLWRLLIEARELGGDRAAARSARAGYRRALAELDEDVPVSLA